MAVEIATDYHMFIDGTPAESSSGEWLEVRSPATRELVGRAPAGTGPTSTAPWQLPDLPSAMGAGDRCHWAIVSPS